MIIMPSSTIDSYPSCIGKLLFVLVTACRAKIQDGYAGNFQLMLLRAKAPRQSFLAIFPWPKKSRVLWTLSTHESNGMNTRDCVLCTQEEK